jgi:hypothetical protein
LTPMQRLLLPHRLQRPKDPASAGPVWAYLRVNWWTYPFLTQTSYGYFEAWRKGSIGHDQTACHFCLFGAIFQVTGRGKGCISE